MGPLGLFLTNTFGIRDKVVNAFKAIWNFVRDGAGKVANFIKGIPGKLGNIGQAIWGKIKDGWNAVGQFVREKVGSVATFIKDIPGKVGNVGSLIWGKIKDGWNAVGQFVRDKIADLVGWFKGIPGKLGNFGSALAGAITGPFKSAGTRWLGSSTAYPDITIPIPFRDDVTIGIPNIPTMQRGGRVPGRGSSDSVPAMLTPGEAVLNAKQIARLGGYRALQAAGVPGFADGGKVLPGTSHDYPARKTLNAHQIADLVYRKGWKNKDRQEEAVMVVLGESSGRWGAHYTGGGKEDSWGGWQINRKAHGDRVSVARAVDPEGSTVYRPPIVRRPKVETVGSLDG